MAVELATAYISLIPSMKGTAAAIKSEMDPAGASAGRSAGQSIATGVSGAVVGAGKAAALGLLGIGVAGIAAGVQTAGAMEQANIAFTTMLGSGEKASAFLSDLQAFAAKTPFEFPELQTAASSLISSGIEASKVIPIMTTLGDVTSGMGTGSEGVQRATVALQQMQAAGKITGEDLNQLRDAGIPVYDLLASATGKSKDEIVKLAASGKLGKKELDAMMKALETGKGLERFNGLMEQQSGSLFGMLSTLKDTVGQGLAEAIKPAFPAIKAGLAMVTAALPGAIAAFQGFIAGVIGFGEWVGANQGLVTAILAGLGAMIFAVLVPAMWAWISAIWASTVALLANPITWIVLAIGLLVLGLVLLVQNWDSVWGAITSGLGALGANIVKFFSAMGSGIAGAWNALVAWLAGIWSAIVSGVSGMASRVSRFFSSLWSAVVAVARAAWQGLVSVWNGIVSGVSAMAAGIGKKISEAVAFIKGLPGKALSALGNLAGRLVSTGRDFIQGFINGIKDAAGRLVSAVTGAVTGAIDAAKRLLGINSPSRVMMEIGWQTGEGFALGIEGRQGRASQAAAALAQAATGGVSLASGLAVATAARDRREASGSSDLRSALSGLRVELLDSRGVMGDAFSARLALAEARI